MRNFSFDAIFRAAAFASRCSLLVNLLLVILSLMSRIRASAAALPSRLSAPFGQHKFNAKLARRRASNNLAHPVPCDPVSLDTIMSLSFLPDLNHTLQQHSSFIPEAPLPADVTLSPPTVHGFSTMSMVRVANIQC
jgi:hypothetical protein